MRTTLLTCFLTGALACGGFSTARAGTELEAPVRIEAAGEAIDCEVGHAAPFVHDWNGDGVWDLLVGQMGQGRLRIFLNVGTPTEPRFEQPLTFKAGEADGTVPSG